MRTFWVLGLCFGVFLYGCKEGAQETANVLTVKEFLALQEGPFDGYVIFPKATYDSLFSKAKEYPLDSIKAKTSKIRFFDLSVSEIPRNAIIPKGPSIKDVIIATLNCPNGKVPTRTGEYRWECLDPEEPYIFLEGECTSFLRIEEQPKTYD